MRLALIGAGQQGSACVEDWLRQPDITAVTVLDRDPGRIEQLRRRLQDGRVEGVTCDATDRIRLVEALRGSAALVSAVPHSLNLGVTRAAIEARVPMVDLGGDTDVVLEQRKLDSEAKAQGVAILPDQGLAPGLAGILAAHGMRDFDRVESIKMRVGALPQFPTGSLGATLVLAIDGFLNQYTGDSIGLENGQVSRKPTMTGLEEIRFPAPIGHCQAAYASGGSSTLPWTLEGKVRTLDYKTIRYPGHWSRFTFLKELGLLGLDPIPVGEVSVAPRDLLAELLAPRLVQTDTRDVVLLRVRIQGIREGRPMIRRYELIDYFDEKTGLTATMRSTAYPASESALLLARGHIESRGVLAGETVIPGEPYVRALRARGLLIKESEMTVNDGEEG